MDEEKLTTSDSDDIGHEIGEHNVQVMGLDIHNPVFLISAVLAVSVVAGTLLFQAQAAALFSDVRAWITLTFDWFFMIVANIFVLFGLGLAISKLGRIRLGGRDVVGNPVAIVVGILSCRRLSHYIHGCGAA